MIAFVRTACIAPGKTRSMMEFAHEIAAHFKSVYDVPLEVLLPIGGNPSRIAWSGRYKDLAALESVTLKMATDKAYWALVEKHSSDFVPGSLHDSIWRTA